MGDAPYRKVDQEFVEQAKDTISSVLGVEDYSCFKDLEIKPDENTADGEEFTEYEVSLKYQVFDGDFVQICFNVRKPETKREYLQDDLEMNTHEDNWHGFSTLHGYEVLWITVLAKVERYYRHKLRTHA